MVIKLLSILKLAIRLEVKGYNFGTFKVGYCRKKVFSEASLHLD